MKMYPMFEKDGCSYYGDESYNGAYFDTEQGEIRFIEVCHYYDLPLICFFQHENGQKYFGSVDCQIFSSDPNREWAYILVPITESVYQDLKNNKMKIPVPFETAPIGYRVLIKDEKDVIEEVNPRDYEKYQHELGNAFLDFTK